MKTLLHLLACTALLLAATTTEAKPPKHTGSRAYYARHYRKACAARVNHKAWPHRAPARY